MFHKKRIGEILVKKGIATPERIEEALFAQRKQIESGAELKKLGEILEDMGFASKENIKSALDEQKKFYMHSWLYSVFHIQR